MDLSDFLLDRIAEDEAAAQAAVQRARPGVHWQWVTNDTDTVVAPGDLAEAQQRQVVSLRTVEEFPTASVGPLPGFLISHAEEVDPGAGDHIARWDPARVLAECEAKRRIVEEYVLLEGPGSDWGRGYVKGAAEQHDQTLRLLALPYADHADYDEEWRV